VKKALLLVVIAVFCTAQRSRDDYRAAYRAWREADPAIEREAAAGGPEIARRADRLTAEAAKCAAARKVFLDGMTQDEADQVAWLENAAPAANILSVSGNYDVQFVASETSTVTRNIATFSNDPDRGIQQLRQALEKERAALETLSVAVAQRQPLTNPAVVSSQVADQSRIKALEQSRAMLQGLKDASAATGKESAAWAEYYRKLGEGAQGEAKPITQIPPGVPPATVTNPVEAPPTVTPLPLVRYTGEWIFPAKGTFRGSEPESFEIAVTEQKGQAKGTVTGRFKVPPGGAVDPVFSFTFSGPFQSTRNQSFPLITQDGTKGTVELIPGPAFNLLEVNVQTEAKEGRIQQADVVVVKK
jgi:hypothetical protein